MSKERMEEIRNKAIKDTVVITNKETNKINYGHSFTLLDEDYQYLNKQAELAQEWESIARTQLDAKLEIESHCLELDAQNKRYREAIGKHKNCKI